MKTKTINLNKAKRVAAWAVAALVLIATGFLLDGSTEIGHHAFLILGGIAIGAGATRELT